VVGEHIRRLNDVVIDTDQNHVVFVHGATSPDGPTACPYSSALRCNTEQGPAR
jgi:hypothetical protein